MNNPLISVIVPIYNAEKFLSATLDALIAQSYKNLEIILVDDGSTDASGKICDEYAENHANIKVIHQKNSGVCVARNSGIASATGEYIGFCDSDDMPDNYLYETLYSIISEHNAELSMVDVRIVLPNGTEKDTASGKTDIWENPADFAKAFFTQYMNIGVYTKLFKRELCNQISFREGKKINEDMFYFFEAATLSRKTVHKGVSKYTYYRREGSSTLNGFSDKFFDCIYFTDEIIKITEKKFSQFTDYAVANKISTSLRVLKRMYTMGGVKKYPKEHDKLIEYVKSYDKAFCKKYLKKNDYIRYTALKIGKLPFKILTKYFDKY